MPIGTSSAASRRIKSRQAHSNKSPATVLLAAAIAALVIGAYAGSLKSPFLFDDVPAIVDNATIRNLWPPPLSPPIDSTVGARPVANLTLAFNYALGGADPWGYRALNVLIHLLAALLLFGVVRRTLQLDSMSDTLRKAAALVAAAVAALWALHPLQTESVTYIVQRVESLMGMFYLLTLYCVLRGATCLRPRRWYITAVAACLLGMGSKEVMATAPVVILFYDRVFLAGSFRAAILKRWRLYACLAACWIPLGALVLVNSSRGGTAGFTGQVSPWSYALLQCVAVLDYLKLSAWPAGLCFDYGPFSPPPPSLALPAAGVVLALTALTAFAWRRHKMLAMPAAAFFLILTPSSSFIPVATQGMAEHRMYLPLACVAIFCVLAAFGAARRLIASARTRRVALASAALLATAALTWATIVRNADYSSEVSIWKSAAAARPDNARAWNNLGNALITARQHEQAVAPLTRALEIDNGYFEAHENLGIVLANLGRHKPAIEQFMKAIAIRPDCVQAYYNCANSLLSDGRAAESLPMFRRAIELRDDSPEAHCSYGNALAQLSQNDEALEQYRRAVELRGNYPEAHYNMGNLFIRQNKIPQAVECYRQALKLNPNLTVARENLQSALILLDSQQK